MFEQFVEHESAVKRLTTRSVAEVANWLGLGESNIVQIPCDADNEIRPCLLETELKDLLKTGRKVAAIVATTGTTDAFGLDDLEAILELEHFIGS